MTLAPPTIPKDLKVLIREEISKICPPRNVPREYEALQFCLSLEKPGTQGHHLLVGLSTTFGTHMRFGDELLHHPNSLQDSPSLTLPWHEPPYMA